MLFVDMRNMVPMLMLLMLGFGVTFNLLAPAFMLEGRAAHGVHCHTVHLPLGALLSIDAPSVARLENADGPLLLFGGSSLDLSAGSATWQSFWSIERPHSAQPTPCTSPRRTADPVHCVSHRSIFGYFDVGEFSASPSAAFVTPLLLYVYLFAVAMPVINLLIAMFSESYQAISNSKANAYWRLRNVARAKNFLGGYQGRTWCTPTPCTFH